MSPATDGEPRRSADAHAAPLTDSAGQAWAGRSFEPNTHAADDGRAPAALIDAITRFANQTVDASVVVDAFREARLLIPLLAELGEAGEGVHGLAADKSQELSIVSVAGPDGRTVLPVFSSVEAMARWNTTARPVPADGVRVALAAADERTDVVVLDPGSDTEFAVRRPAVWAIAQSRPWVPSHDDESVVAAFRSSISREPAVVGLDVEPGDPFHRLVGPELIVRLRLVAGLTRPELDAVLTRLAEVWAADETIAERVDSLAVRIVAAD